VGEFGRALSAKGEIIPLTKTDPAYIKQRSIIRENMCIPQIPPVVPGVSDFRLPAENAMSRNIIKTIRCPNCRKPAPWEGNPFRPFCSERCRMIDLGAWVDESYRIPGDKKPEEEEE
jgi:endogenous inhibitor of DNA gyrase (YacG/DUF329 family)